MNTQQRPTPETDAAEINLGSACGQFSEWYVKPDFARKLERERDEAREKLEAMREALEWILNSASNGSIPDGRNLWAITQKAQQTLAKL